MAVPIIGNAGVVAEVDEARNVQTFQAIPGYPAAGGFYVTHGFSSTAASTPASVAAALAADTMLMSARFSAGSTRKAYIYKLNVQLVPVIANAAAIVPGILGFRRFTAQTPTGGIARTAARVAGAKGSASDMTDIRDSNAALTGTAPTWGDILAGTEIPVLEGALAAGMTQLGYTWELKFEAPIELAAGDGVALRTLGTCPATATWTYAYNMHWFER